MSALGLEYRDQTQECKRPAHPMLRVLFATRSLPQQEIPSQGSKNPPEAIASRRQRQVQATSYNGFYLEEKP